MAALPAKFNAWFDQRGWQVRAHQLETVLAARAGENVLLTAPTGGGKTLAGFLPALIDLDTASLEDDILHTLYISPLKALAVDIARNLTAPVAEMGLDIRIEARSGDTPPSRRQRQRRYPPHMLLTTPEQVALLLSYKEAARYFAKLKYVILDELHALAGNKRGDLLALDLARLRRLAPEMRVVALSATVAAPERLMPYIASAGPARHVDGGRGPMPQVSVHSDEQETPWAGHYPKHAYGAVYAAIRAHKTSLVFVNTRAQAEAIFHELWRLNDDNLAIALHHGSLAPEQRRKVEAAMSRGDLAAVVCTATLDLGVDWGAVDLVINIGAPKGLSRLTQRIGRANHRLDQPSAALLVPSNRFEVLECEAARAAVREGELDDEAAPDGALDVLAQHILGMGCAAPFDASELYSEVTTAAPYANLSHDEFDRVLDFVATGGYALRRYERYKRLRQNKTGHYTVASATVVRQYRMNAGTIVQGPLVKVKLKRGRMLGEIDEGFIEQLTLGDTFAFAGEILRFEGFNDTVATVTRSTATEPQVPSYYGGKFPLSTFLAKRVRDMLAEPARQRKLPKPVKEWLSLQRWRSVLPKAGDLLVETFPRNDKHYMIAYPFEGRLAHQTLGMLLTRRMERAGLRPMGFVASEYALAVWSLKPVKRPDPLFEQDMLGDDLEEWLAESYLMKRSFRNVAVIAGLVDRHHPGREKTGRQLTVSSDLIYDVLRQYEPDHILLRATRHDAARGLLDLKRLGDMLARVQGRVRHLRLDRVSPLAVPLLLDIGKEPISGDVSEFLLDEAAKVLVAEATRLT